MQGANGWNFLHPWTQSVGVMSQMLVSESNLSSLVATPLLPFSGRRLPLSAPLDSV